MAWRSVRQLARLGAERDTIVVALGITKAHEADAEVLLYLDHEIARGHALYQCDLLEEARRLRMGGRGSANTLLAAARNSGLRWDRRDRAQGDKRPDDAAAVAELGKFLDKLREARGKAG